MPFWRLTQFLREPYHVTQVRGPESHAGISDLEEFHLSPTCMMRMKSSSRDPRTFPVSLSTVAQGSMAWLCHHSVMIPCGWSVYLHPHPQLLLRTSALAGQEQPCHRDSRGQ